MALDEAAEAAAQVADEYEARRTPGPRTLTLSNGVVLRIKGVAPLAVRQVVLKLKAPEPPKIEIRTGVWEPNPDDPDYKQATAEYERKIEDAALDAMLLLGTELVEVPDGVERPEDEGWHEILSEFEIVPDVSTSRRRYLSWLKLYALNADDLKQVAEPMRNMLGLSEQEVAAAVESFRRGTLGGSDNGSPSPAVADRDIVPAPDGGVGAGDRGA